MKDNQEIVLEYKSTTLVPYKKRFVQKYHDWMTDKELLELTKSEPLTLIEEYEMQEKWVVDEDKLTFIIFEGTMMIGDVNLFTVVPFEVDNLVEKFDLPNVKYAELEIMIAEKLYRTKGHGQNAIQMMISYATSLGFEQFIVRIDIENAASIAFFKRLGFEIIETNSVFKEYLLIYREKSDFYYIIDSFAKFESILKPQN